MKMLTQIAAWTAVGCVAALASARQADAQQDVVFLSTQLRPIEEAQKVREVILKDFKGKVTYLVEEPSPFDVRVRAEGQAGKRTISLVGALHGELSALQPTGNLDSLDDVVAKLADRGVPANLMELGKFGTGNQVYVPWMQATYIMVAKKEALQYLPAGASVDRSPTNNSRPGARRYPTRPASACSAFRRPQGPDAAFLRGLSLSVVHRRRRHVLPLARGLRHVDAVQGASGGTSTRTRPRTISCRSR